MLSQIEAFYESRPEHLKEIYLFLRKQVIASHKDISQEWKYGLPFFYLNGKMFCYLWYNKKSDWPYIAFVDGHKMSNPNLIKGERKRIQVFEINPNEDLPVGLLKELLNEALTLRLGS